MAPAMSIPSSPENWVERAQRAGVSVNSFFTRAASYTDSGMSFKCYLTLQSFSNEHCIFYFNQCKGKFISEDVTLKAEAILKNDPKFAVYLNLIKEYNDMPMKAAEHNAALTNAGAFGLVRYLQLHIKPGNEASPAKTRQFSYYPNVMSTHDEATHPFVRPELYAGDAWKIVKESLICWLNCLKGSDDGHMAWVPMERCIFVGMPKQMIYRACLEGGLTCLRTGKVYAIAMMESHPKDTQLEGYRMEETALMAAWIYAQPCSGHLIGIGNSDPSTKTRVMVCQYREHIYLTFATYTDGYVKYITGQQEALLALMEQKRMVKDHKALGFGKTGPCDKVTKAFKVLFSRKKKELNLNIEGEHFMSMREFGPWNIYRAEEMENLGHILLALSMQQGQQDPIQKVSE